MFGAWLGDAAEQRALDDADVERAFESLTRPSALVLWLETDLAGAPEAQRAALARLRDWLDRSGAREAADALGSASSFPHENALAPATRYIPTTAERRAACASNKWDCALYRRLINQSCVCGAVGPQRTFSPGSQGS